MTMMIVSNIKHELCAAKYTLCTTKDAHTHTHTHRIVLLACFYDSKLSKHIVWLLIQYTIINKLEFSIKTFEMYETVTTHLYSVRMKQMFLLFHLFTTIHGLKFFISLLLYVSKHLKPLHSKKTKIYMYINNPSNHNLQCFHWVSTILLLK